MTHPATKRLTETYKGVESFLHRLEDYLAKDRLPILGTLPRHLEQELEAAASDLRDSNALWGSWISKSERDQLGVVRGQVEWKMRQVLSMYKDQRRAFEEREAAKQERRRHRAQQQNDYPGLYDLDTASELDEDLPSN